MSKDGSIHLQEGIALYKRFQFTKSIDKFHIALEYFLKDNNQSYALICCIYLGGSYSKLGQYQKAIEYHEKSLEIARVSRDKKSEMACYSNLGSAYNGFEQHQKAIEYHEKSLEIAKKIGDRNNEGTCYLKIGVAYNDLNQHQKAIEYFEKSLEIAKSQKDQNAEALCCGNLGDVYSSLGQYQKAIECQEKSLQIAKDTKNRLFESTCYLSIGNAYYGLGQYQKAIDFQEKSLQISKTIGDKRGEGKHYTNLGVVFHELNQHEKAIEYFEKSLEIAKETGDRGDERSLYTNLGSAYGKLGQYYKGIDYHIDALNIAKEIGDKRGEGICYGNLGIAFHRLGQYQKAIEYHEKSLEIARVSRDKKSEMACYSNLGSAYGKLGQYYKGIDYHIDALNIAKEIGDKRGEGICYGNLGDTYYYLNKFNDAYENLMKSIIIYEDLGSNLSEEKSMIIFYSERVNLYTLFVYTCIKLRKNIDAFEFMERSKSKVFLSWISKTEILPKKHVPSDLLQREQELLTIQRHIQTDQTIKNMYFNKIENILEDINAIYKKIEEYDKEYVFLRQGKSLPMKKIQELLDDKTILVEYFITHDKLFIFILTRSKQEKPIVLDISSKDLQNSISEYRNEIIKCTETIKNEQRLPDDLTDISRITQKLGKYLIEPIFGFLNKVEMIIFVPHSILHSIPLHSLPINGIPLGIIKPILYLPHASLLDLAKKSDNTSYPQCASFWADRNQASHYAISDEAKIVAQIFDTKEHEITKEKFRDYFTKNTKNSIVHLACHGIFEPKDPLSSRIMLSDGSIQAGDIYNMRLNCDLLTISACETGISKINPGDELMGLSRAILYAGARSTLLSLWEVESNATKELMVQVYKNIKNGQNTAVALQNAQKYIMNFRDKNKKEIYKHPFFWSAFTLIGNL